MSDDICIKEWDAYALLSHLVSSADTCTYEPYYYGTFRLLDAASRLIEAMLEGRAGEPDPWLRGFKDELDEHKIYMMTDRPRYFSYIPNASGRLAAEMKRRSYDRPPRSTSPQDRE